MGERSRQSNLDDAIDRAVRGMIDVEPRPGFEQRVMRRLQQPRRPVFAWPQLAAAGAALVTTLVGALVLRDAPGLYPAQGPKSSTTTTRTTPAPPPVGSAASPPNVPPVPTFTAPAPSAPRVVTTRPVAPAPRDVMAANVEEETSTESPIATIAALDPPTPLAVESIEQQPVNVPPITVARLEIPELNVQPLPPADQGGKE